MEKSVWFEKLKDPRWQKKRLEIFQRDNWSCKNCGEKSNPLHVHHLFYFKNKEPWEINNGFLITLCESCHLSKKEEDEDEGIQEAVINDIGTLLGTFWNSGYAIEDLLLLAEAIFNEKRKLGLLWEICLTSKYKIK